MLHSIRVGGFGLVAFVLAAQVVSFDKFIPADLLHNYYNFGAEGLLRFKGRALERGVRIVLFGTIEDRSFDSKGSYIDIEGVASTEQAHGVIRVYMASSEFDKLQSSNYSYKSMAQERSGTEIAIEATLVGLNRFGNLEMSAGAILPWAAVISGSNRSERKNSGTTTTTAVRGGTHSAANSVSTPVASDNFDGRIVLQTEYGNYDRSSHTALWEGLAVPNRRELSGFRTFSRGVVEIRFDATYRQLGVNKHIVITSTKPAGQDYGCHACCPLLGAAVFSKLDGKWSMESEEKSGLGRGLWDAPWMSTG